MQYLTNALLASFISCLLICTACQTAPNADAPPKILTSGLDLKNMDTSVAPGDNFQMYVNGNWIKETPIPSDKSNYGIFAILQDKAQEDVKKIIEFAASTENKGGSDEQKVGGLYASYMDMETRNAQGNQSLQAEFEKIELISNYSELAKYFAHANKLSYSVPYVSFVFTDMKNPNQHALYTWQGGLGLPDREYYLKIDEKSVK